MSREVKVGFEVASEKCYLLTTFFVDACMFGFFFSPGMAQNVFDTVKALTITYCSTVSIRLSSFHTNSTL